MKSVLFIFAISFYWKPFGLIHRKFRLNYSVGIFIMLKFKIQFDITLLPLFRLRSLSSQNGIIVI